MRRSSLLILSVFCLAVAGVTAQQKSSTGLKPPDQQQVENNIGEMLAGWQIGDTELMHRNYADDVMVVSGIYEPPVIGWANYVAAYGSQRQRMTGVHLDRRNTFIKVKGDMAWATYQWEFSATADGRPMTARGQATLLFERRGDRWLIVHNHTSMVSGATPQPQPPPAPPSPGSN